MFKKFLASAIVALLLMAPASAEYVIRTEYGGSVTQYIEKYSALDQAEGKLKLDGFCISACTFFLGLMDPAKTCTTQRGVLGFHSASSGFGEFSYEGTKLLWNIYPEKVRERLIREGWDGSQEIPHPGVIYIPARELMPVCANGA